MAAAALARSRAAGLVFVFTLLCLVCLSRSLIDKDELESLKELYKEAQQEIDQLKAEYTPKMQNLSEIVDEYLTIMDTQTALGKRIDALSGDTTPEDTLQDSRRLMEENKVLLKEIRAKIDKTNEEYDEKMAHYEKEMRKMKRLIELIEDLNDEL